MDASGYEVTLSYYAMRRTIYVWWVGKPPHRRLPDAQPVGVNERRVEGAVLRWCRPRVIQGVQPDLGLQDVWV